MIFIGVEHLILGVLRFGDGYAVEVLKLFTSRTF
jgi:hypothetical protein